MMSSGQADQLIDLVKKGQERIAGELVNLTQELFLSRKIMEALLTPEQRARVESYLRPAPLVPTVDDLPFPGEEALQTSQAVINGQAEVGQSGIVQPRRTGHGG